MPRARTARPCDPRIAVAYLRASKGTAVQELSPEAQRAMIEAFAAREGITIVAWHHDQGDKGVSGGRELDDRPALLAALADLCAHRAGTLLLARRDRLARDAYVAMTVDRAVAAAGARIVSADGTANGDSPSDALLRGMLDLFAAHERSMVRERTKAALAAKRAKGQRIGTVPYGYSAGPNGILVSNEAEQGVIRIVRELRAAGMSLRAIESELAKRGILSRSGRHPIALPQIAKIARGEAAAA